MMAAAGPGYVGDASAKSLAAAIVSNDVPMDGKQVYSLMRQAGFHVLAWNGGHLTAHKAGRVYWLRRRNGAYSTEMAMWVAFKG